MKKYICIGKWKVWGSCGHDHWTVLDWTDDYEKAREEKQKAELDGEDYEDFWIEEKITILKPLE